MLSSLGALAGYSLFRGVLMRDIAMGFMIALPAIAVMALIYTLFPDKKNMDWLYEEPGLGEDALTVLDLKKQKPPDREGPS